MDFLAQSVIWLSPDANSPCDIHFFFRGQYPLALPAGQPVSFEFLQKLGRAGYSHIYIKVTDEEKWAGWVQQRLGKAENKAENKAHNNAETKDSARSERDSLSELYGNKRAEYLSYIQKNLHIKDATKKKIPEAKEKTETLINSVIKSPVLDWYFNKFHEPPDLFYHGARVTYSALLFSVFHGLFDQKKLEDFAFSMIIHEIEGDPAENAKAIVSQVTVDYLAKKKIPVPQSVLDLIRMQDELYSGKGFPKQLKTVQVPMEIRVFSYFNLFDHYRLKAKGTRRSRIDATKKKMEERAKDFDPDLWDKFWSFWEEQWEAIS